jgi:hypothetical protein
MAMKKPTTKFGMVGIFALVAILATSTVVLAFSQSAVAAPANKTAFGASSGLALASVQDPDFQKFKTIVSGTIKTSSPSDLLVTHDQECAIHTGLNLDTSNDDATSAIREDVRLKVTGADGIVRFIDPTPLGDEGRYVAAGGEEADDDTTSKESLTMCGRAYHIDTNILEQIWELCGYVEGINPDENNLTCDTTEPIFNSFIATKQAHGWSWVVPNMGSGVHTIEVQAKLVDSLADITLKGKKTTNTDNSKCSLSALNPDPTADCVDTVLEVGKRTLIITEQKFSSDI